MKMTHLVVALGLLAAFVQPLPASAQVVEAPRTISVTGEGRVAAPPDMATLQLGVNQTAETAGAALDATSQATAAVLARIEAAGIAPRDVQTSGLTLNPRWDRRGGDNGKMEVVGYDAANMLSVRVRDLSLLGGLLDAVVRDGANTFHGLTFGLANPEPLLDEAREKAVAEALRKARLLATAAGVELGPLQSLSEQGASGPRPPSMRMDMAMEAAVPVAEGEVELAVSVYLVFAIAD